MFLMTLQPLLPLLLLLLLQVEQVVPFSPDCTLRVMRLSSTSSDGSHMLCHYHFHAWPDHGTPGSSAGLRAVCRSLSTARESGAPVLVHCSAVRRHGRHILFPAMPCSEP
jgi:protein tyrosine phosphatase